MVDTKSIAWSAIVNGAVVAAIITGAFTFWGQNLESERNQQSQLIMRLLQHDSQENRNVVSSFRTMNELGVIDLAEETGWRDHVNTNHGSLPRFYHSGFIWSVFYPHVDDIKAAYKELGYYEGEIDGKVDAAFVLATMRHQYAQCQKLGRTTCSSYADGIMGKNTFRELAFEMDERNLDFRLD